MEQLKAKIIAIVGRLGVTETMAEVVIALVRQSDGRKGGRPKKPVMQTAEPVIPCLLPESDLDLSSSGTDQVISNPERAIPGTTALAVVRPPSEFDHALQLFCALWEQKYGVKYIARGKDRNHLGRLLADIPRTELPGLRSAFINYLTDNSPFVAQEMRHNLTHFCNNDGFNKYRATATVMSAKEARGVTAAQQWIARRGNDGK